MDCTQIFFSMQVPAVEFFDSASVVVPAPEFDLGASIFLVVDKSACGVNSLFFTLHSSLENAVFHVREVFEKLVISVKSGIGKVFGKVRSMWRERIIPRHFPNVAKHSAVLVMRT